MNLPLFEALIMKTTKPSVSRSTVMKNVYKKQQINQNYANSFSFFIQEHCIFCFIVMLIFQKNRSYLQQ